METQLEPTHVETEALLTRSMTSMEHVPAPRPSELAVQPLSNGPDGISAPSHSADGSGTHDDRIFTTGQGDSKAVSNPVTLKHKDLATSSALLDGPSASTHARHTSIPQPASSSVPPKSFSEGRNPIPPETDAVSGYNLTLCSTALNYPSRSHRASQSIDSYC